MITTRTWPNGYFSSVAVRSTDSLSLDCVPWPTANFSTLQAMTA